MKTKLLRKLRRRFEIIHHRNGYFKSGVFYNGEALTLIDHSCEFGGWVYEVKGPKDLKKKIEECRQHILKEARKKYSHKTGRVKRAESTKIWYNQ